MTRKGAPVPYSFGDPARFRDGQLAQLVEHYSNSVLVRNVSDGEVESVYRRAVAALADCFAPERLDEVLPLLPEPPRDRGYCPYNSASKGEDS